jgi:arylsulfatase A-like enzyme/tetratricopeptide (TPR) repeat protein
MCDAGQTLRPHWIALAIAATAACSHPAPPVDLPRSPDQNVLLITVDTLRADALGCDGGPARTPNIDRLAAAGLHFSFAHAHSVVTLPSHATILTGRYPFAHGVRDNAGYRLAPGSDTLATRLHAAGFATGAFVGAFPLDARFGLTPGFDVYDGRFDDAALGSAFALPERPAPAVVARATDWIRAQPRKWFAWVHVYEPHAPYRPPPPFDVEYRTHPYFGEVAAVDRALGALLDLAAASARPTLVVLTGDHGEALGDHGEATHGLFAYESTLRVPLIVAALPGRGAGASGRAGRSGADGALGSVSDALARHVDIVPTVLDVLGLPQGDLPGHSLRTDADRQSGADRPSYFEAMSGALDYGAAPLEGVVVGRQKYIRLPIPELYDLAADSGERDNLIARAGDRARTLEHTLASFGAAGPGLPRQEDRETASRLRSLGYASSGAGARPRYSDADDPKRLVWVDGRMHEAVALGEQGRLPEAIAIYRDVLQKRPELVAAARHLAFAEWRVGNAAEAIGTLEAARRAPGADAGLRVQLGTYLFEAGRVREAIAELEAAAAPGDDLDALNALGLALARSGRASDALAAFDQALRLDPANATTHANIGALDLDAGRLADARSELERALAVSPDSSSTHAALALVMIKSGDRAAAITEWTRAVQLDATNFDALYNLGVQLAEQGRAADARPYLERFSRTAPPGEYAKALRTVRALLDQRR